MGGPASPNPIIRQVGSRGQPIRAIAFASGGFETAMDIGVIHALLVIQGKAPDVAVGISAGAINAVALAEILQAKPSPTMAGTPESAQQLAQVARFREMLEAYANAPADLTAAYLPDTLQVEAGRPLEPLRLPIHNQREWDGRDDQLHARQGLVRLFNFLLRTRLSFATLTRFVRRFLGIRAAGQVRAPLARWIVQGYEFHRSWSLIGANLHRITEIALEVVGRPFFKSSVRRPGATAAWALFQRRWSQSLTKFALYALSFAVLMSIWVTATTVVVGGVLAIGLWVTSLSSPWPAMAALVAGVSVAGSIGYVQRTGLLRQLRAGQRTSTWLLGEFILQSFEIVGLSAVYIGVPVLATALILLAMAPPGGPTPNLVAIGWRTLQAMAVLTAASLLVLGLRWPFIRGDYRRRFLEQFDLADGLLSKHPLFDTFVRLFDPDYYGPRKMDDVVDRSLRDDDRPSNGTPQRKLIGHYSEHDPPIEVGLIVANGGSGYLEVVEASENVVDGLYAATAVTPLLPPSLKTGKLLLDGANIASEPTPGVLELLRDRTHPDASVIHIYSVSPLPFSAPVLRDEGPDAPVFSNIVDVTRRALLLQRFRDASLERRLTEIYTKSMPAGRAVYRVGDRNFLRAWVTPIEPDKPLELHQRLFEATSKEAKRDTIAEAVAEGCRAALQVMIRASQPGETGQPGKTSWIPCRRAVSDHLSAAGATGLRLLADIDPDNQPSSLDRDRSGLPEVCRHCRLARPRPAPSDPETLQHHLHFRAWESIGPAWPHQAEPPKSLIGDPHFKRMTTLYEQRTTEALATYKSTLDSGTDTIPKWPLDRRSQAGTDRPLISLLFSGGVFRGVYQLGTLNALAELGLAPDVVAGASVGSITAAMVAQALSFEGDQRRARIARLAATYLALDHLILTDRFADFIRGLTLRAGSSRFSLAEADRVFRRYDRRSTAQYANETRRVVAGLERLFWLSPFELLELLKAFRLGDLTGAAVRLKTYTQEWLERMGVGREVLGAEPLALLIAEHVLQPLPGQGPVNSATEPFDRFLQRGIYFLATTTNLSAGRLEVLGEQQFAPSQLKPMLLEGLLASSAFPAVFRPRWSWEVIPGCNVRHQYIDGGVIDNLPLDGVVHFLRDAAEAGLISKRPKHGAHEVPHLLFGASLETEVAEYTSIADLERFTKDWVALQQRAGKLRYNKKLELYATTQRALRQIRRQYESQTAWRSIDLEVVTVKPKWLVGTFAFHPMLGFRRDNQAASIAHGCATTLATFSDLMHDQQKLPWLVPWGVDLSRVPTTVVRHAGALVPQQLSREQERKGVCRFRPNCQCPFSRAGLDQLPPPRLPPATTAELDRIYRLCGRADTHQPRD